MITSILLQLFERDLHRLKKEISAYENERDLWRLEGEILNTPGNLCLHIVGNLNHFIGATLGNTGYQRQRNREFSDKNVQREQMLSAVDDTLLMLKEVLPKITENQLYAPYPINVFGDNEYSTIAFLMHLTTHLDYHLGQINYHRRMIK